MKTAIKFIPDPTYSITGLGYFDFTQPAGRELPEKKTSGKLFASTSPQCRFDPRAAKVNEFAQRKK